MPSVALVQLTTTKNLNQNLNIIGEQIKAAAQAGAALVILPENCVMMGDASFRLSSIAEKKGSGPIQSELSRLARHYGIWLIAGTVPTQAQGGRVRASSLVFDDRGELVSTYDKIHLFDVIVPEGESHQESQHIEPGSLVVTVDTPVGCLGLSVCYDLRFPELYRQLVLKGAEIFTVPAAFTAITGQAHWEILLRARAIENLCYVLAPNQCGHHENGRHTYGRSMIIDPWGKKIASLEDEVGMLTAEIELSYLRTLRKDFPCNEHHIMA